MKPYGREALAPELILLVCEGCYEAGSEPISKGVICPVCAVDLCWLCMEAHLKTETHLEREMKVERRRRNE